MAVLMLAMVYLSQKFAYSKSKSDVIAKMDGTFTERKRKKTEEGVSPLSGMVMRILHTCCYAGSICCPTFYCAVLLVKLHKSSMRVECIRNSIQTQNLSSASLLLHSGVCMCVCVCVSVCVCVCTCAGVSLHL